MLQVERFFRQSRNKLNTFRFFRLCRKDEISQKNSFDIVAVRRCRKNRRLVAVDNVVSTLLLAWAELKLTAPRTIDVTTPLSAVQEVLLMPTKI